MKCPKCGFVSYAGLEQCTKCGYAFKTAAPKGSSSRVTTLFPEGVRSGSLPPSEPQPGPSENSPRARPELSTQQTPPAEAAPERVTSSKESLSGADPVPMDWHPQGWREELSERVENFRKRRARLQPDADPEGNLELDFEDPGKPQNHRSLDDALGAPEEKESAFDMEIGESSGARGKDHPSGEAFSLDASDDEMMELDASPEEAEEMSLGEPSGKSPPMEILVASPTEIASEEDVEEGIYLAPLGRRLLAGLTDALVLVLGAAEFGVIFWRVCGRLSFVPLNLAVLGLVTVIFIFAYFAVFTAIASATPGLLWMGCEIRNLRGGHPNVRESLWRAFGVLVSGSALMLGFVWAVVDTHGLTWHDHMSGTAIAMDQTTAALAGLKA